MWGKGDKELVVKKKILKYLEATEQVYFILMVLS